MPSLSEQELDEYATAFASFDTGSGTITFEELGVIMSSLITPPTESQIERMVTDIDPDSNGKVYFAVFLTIMSRHVKVADTRKEISNAFRVFDKEGTGFMPTDKLRYIMTNIGETLTDEDVDKMLSEAEIDENGLLDYEKLVDVMFSK
ncbi:calmodulin-like [Teleopsis dalmanni]|uniref:calmodulin-like n=1 Tax=Teleopsis dalmanni TaxID=139649 RepID=UPI0018CF03E9|nr:calmodulin-like [Teleopsis dalmanni]